MPVRRRALGLLLALVLEALLVLALLTLGTGRPESRPDQPALITFDIASPAADPQPAAPSTNPEEPAQPKLSLPTPRQVQPATPPLPLKASPDTPVKVPTPLIELPRETIAAADLGARPATPAPSRSRGRSGPPAPAGSGDTPLVAGSGPNGERLYAAAWYREPYDEELRGYLSTAQGPGWALIACRTVADFRVDDCVGLDEYPDGSRIGRAVLAAAWQFRVRPPQIGGRSMVGEWVRIRIDYTDRPRG